VSIYRSFEKTFGDVHVRLSEPSPRWLEIERTDRSDCRLFGLNLEQARDLHYALGRLIAQADDDDSQNQPKSR
jgi:hypothetical protein